MIFFPQGFVAEHYCNKRSARVVISDHRHARSGRAYEAVQSDVLPLWNAFGKFLNLRNVRSSLGTMWEGSGRRYLRGMVLLSLESVFFSDWLTEGTLMIRTTLLSTVAALAVGLFVATPLPCGSVRVFCAPRPDSANRFCVRKRDADVRHSRFFPPGVVDQRHDVRWPRSLRESPPGFF